MNGIQKELMYTSKTKFAAVRQPHTNIISYLQWIGMGGISEKSVLSDDWFPLKDKSTPENLWERIHFHLKNLISI